MTTIEAPSAETTLAILRISDQKAYFGLEAKLDDLRRLKEFGWTEDEFFAALRLGYCYRAHLRPTYPYSNAHPNTGWQYGCSAWPMYGWLRHYYRSWHVVECDMDFDTFVSTWLSVAGDRRFTHQALHPTRIGEVYFKGRRIGLDDEEARTVLWGHGPAAYRRHTYHETYFALRRRLSKELTGRIVTAMQWSGKQHYDGDVKYVMEALKRVGSVEKLIACLKSGNEVALAIHLRGR